MYINGEKGWGVSERHDILESGCSVEAGDGVCYPIQPRVFPLVLSSVLHNSRLKMCYGIKLVSSQEKEAFFCFQEIPLAPAPLALLSHPSRFQGKQY